MKIHAFASIKELRSQLSSKQISYNDVVDFSLKRFETHDSRIESALEVFDKASIIAASLPEEAPLGAKTGLPEEALAKAGLLSGIPGIIKDNICMKNRIASCASKILENFNSPIDATVISRLKKEGALLIGRANMDEFAMGSSTETSAFKKTKNPWDLSRVPGGSSGGSAAAVAAGLVPWALGTDTGGSVRQPAAFCGIVGIKPTYGLVSRYGIVAYGSSLDQVGVMSRTVYDNALVLSVIAGHDAKDSSSLPVERMDYTKNLTGTIPSTLRIGVIENALNNEGVDSEISAAVEQAIIDLESLGAQVTRVALPTLDYSTAAYFILSRAEAASNLARFDGVRYGMRNDSVDSLAAMYANTRHDGFGSEVKTRIMVGNYVLSAGHAGQYYENANKVRRLICHELSETFKSVDLLIMPTHSTPAFTFGAFDVDKLQMDMQDYFTCPANVAGVPAISLPCGLTKNSLPIGFQLIGPHLSEQLLYQVAHAYEQKTQWHTMHPNGF